MFRFCVSSCLNFQIDCMGGPDVIPAIDCKITSDYTGDVDVDLEDFALYQLRFTPYLVEK